MRAQYLIALVSVAISSASCVRKVYYVSPVYGSNAPYHSVPLKNEQTASAVYGNASLQNATHNDWGLTTLINCKPTFTVHTTSDPFRLIMAVALH